MLSSVAAWWWWFRMVANSSGAGVEDRPENGGSDAGGVALKKGPWTAAEDAILVEYVTKHGEGNWNAVQKNSGLARCGKSCRLRWANHLRPNLKKGSFSAEEERVILELHAKLGNKWARMAAQLPGRTDNEIKNYWNTRIKRRLRQGLPVYPQEVQNQSNTVNQPNFQNPPYPQSPCPPSQTLFSSSPQFKPAFSSSLSLFDPITTLSAHQTSPILTPPYQRYKRSGDTGPDFPLPFSQASLPSPLPSSSLPNQFSHISPLQLNPVTFCQNSLPILQTQFKFDQMVPPVLDFSINPELPSSQFSKKTHPYTADNMKINSSSSNCGLLDELIGQAQAMVCNDSSRRQASFGSQEEKHMLNDFELFLSGSSTNPPFVSGPQWADSTSLQPSTGEKPKQEPADDVNSMNEDLSDMLIFHPAPNIPEWYSDNGVSIKQSSSITEDDIGLDIPQLTSSSPVATTTDHGWTPGSSSWDNFSGIC